LSRPMRTLDEALHDSTLLAKTENFVARRGATMRPAASALAIATARMASLRAGEGEALAGRLELHGTLGEGGMGIVRLAEQKALGRRVAVKTLREVHAGDDTIALKLLQEAWVTGRLEHPNVVPVHDLFVDRDGRPHIVLKRIEGRRWADVMHDRVALEAVFGVGEALEHNLGVFVQVCHAVAFAHQRGIVHRDLKPDNVMIGEFGEVVVLDWGIALALHEDESGRVPHVSSATEAAGTPAYMAPEMLGGESPRIGATTDVYLLGAVLYEILEGKPPHDGESFPAMIASILESKPPLSPHAPAELARIVERAMDADPDARFECSASAASVTCKRCARGPTTPTPHARSRRRPCAWWSTSSRSVSRALPPQRSRDCHGLRPSCARASTSRCASTTRSSVRCSTWRAISISAPARARAQWSP